MNGARPLERAWWFDGYLRWQHALGGTLREQRAQLANAVLRVCEQVRLHLVSVARGCRGEWLRGSTVWGGCLKWSSPHLLPRLHLFPQLEEFLKRHAEAASCRQAERAIEERVARAGQDASGGSS